MTFQPNKAVNTHGTSTVGYVRYVNTTVNIRGARQLLNSLPSILCPLQVLEIKCWLPKWLCSSLVSDLWSRLRQKKERVPTAPCISFCLTTSLRVINTLRSFFGVHLFSLSYIYFISFHTFLQLPSLLFVLYHVSLFLFVSSRSLHYFSCRSGPPKVTYTLQRFLGHLTFNRDD